MTSRPPIRCIKCHAYCFDTGGGYEHAIPSNHVPIPEPSDVERRRAWELERAEEKRIQKDREYTAYIASRAEEYRVEEFLKRIDQENQEDCEQGICQHDLCTIGDRRVDA